MADDDRTMPLLGHLTELRSRLIKALIAVALAFIPAYAFAEYLFAFLTQPLQQCNRPADADWHRPGRSVLH